MAQVSGLDSHSSLEPRAGRPFGTRPVNLRGKTMHHWNAWLVAALGIAACVLMGIGSAWAQVPDLRAAEVLPLADEENPCGSGRRSVDSVQGRICDSAVDAPAQQATTGAGSPCANPTPIAPPGLEYQTIANVSPICREPGDLKDVEIWLKRTIDRYIAYGLVAGAAASIVKDGKVIAKYGAGFADTAGSKKVNADTTMFRAGSISKMLTWTAVMQLAEQGKIDLDADVNVYLKKFQIPGRFPQPVTMRNLMTHTAGFEDNKWGFMLEKDEHHLLPLEEVLATHIPARIWPATSNFADGRHAAYSNWGAALGGYIVQEVSGIPFDEYVQKNIFGRLGMSHSTFQEPIPKDLREEMANGYKVLNYGTAEPFEFFHGIAPAGSLSTSAVDMAHFMIAQLQYGRYENKHILEEQTARTMQSRMLSPSPYVNGSGYGWFETYVNGWRTIGHGGKTINFRSEMTLIPQAGVGIFVTYNTMPATDIAKGLVNNFLNVYFPATIPDVTPPADFATRAHQYVGSYGPNSRSHTKSEGLFEMSWGFDVAATPVNTLTIKGAQWIEVGKDTFRRLDGQDMLTFLRDEHGAVSHLVGPQAFNPAYKLPPRQANAFHAVSLAIAAIATWSDAIEPPRLLWVWVIFGLLLLAAAVAPRLFVSGNPVPAARPLAIAAGAIGLLLFAALVQTLADLVYRFSMLLTEIPWYLQATTVLWVLGVLATAGMGYCAFLAWRRSAWTLYARIEYSVLFLASASYLAWLLSWKILHPG